MKDFASVNVFERKTHLSEPIHYFCFCEVVWLCPSFLDMESEITNLSVSLNNLTFAKLHYDNEDPFVNERSSVTDDVGMI